MLRKDLACVFYLALTPVCSCHFAALSFQLVYIFLRYKFCFTSCLAQVEFMKTKLSEDCAFPCSY